MKPITQMLGRGSQTASLFIGMLVILLAATVYMTARQPQQIMNWVSEIFGIAFVVIAVMLILIALYAWIDLQEGEGIYDRTLTVAGLSAANGITTLALTWTLLGIALGIGTLAEQSLTPQTVNEVIRNLVSHFSMAFMTTVAGLPVAALLRSLILIAQAQREQQLQQSGESNHASNDI